jgi:hypothetical protein
MKTKLARKKPTKRRLLSQRRHRARNLATLAGNATENIVQILRQNQVFHLSEPIDLTVREEGGKVLIGYRPLGLEGFGADRFEALECFVDQFAALWDWIAAAKGKEMTPTARKQKRTLQAMVDHVTGEAAPDSHLRYDDEEAFMDDEDYRIGQEREREGKFLTLEQFRKWHEKRRLRAR